MLAHLSTAMRPEIGELARHDNVFHMPYRLKLCTLRGWSRGGGEKARDSCALLAVDGLEENLARL